MEKKQECLWQSEYGGLPHDTYKKKDYDRAREDALNELQKSIAYINQRIKDKNCKPLK